MIGCASSHPIVSEYQNQTNEIKQNTAQSRTEHITDSTLSDRLREIIVRNDTVYIHDSIYLFKYRYRYLTDTLTDTLYINRTDTLRTTTTIEVEKRIAPFVRNSCITLWVLIVMVVIGLVIYLVWGFAKGKFSWTKIITKLFSRR